MCWRCWNYSVPLKAEILVHLPLSLRTHLPAVGSVVRSPVSKSQAVFRVLGIRNVVGEKKVAVRLQPIPRSERDVMLDMVKAGQSQPVAEWPRHPASGRPAGAVAAPKRTPGTITTRQQAAKAQRQRAVQLLADDRDPARVIPTARITNKNATGAEWRDPDDHNVQRRTPRVVQGHRNFDSIEYFVSINTFSKRQERTARRLRETFDRAGGVRLGYDRMLQSSAGFGPTAGLSEQLVVAIQALESARNAIGVSGWPIIYLAILADRRLSEIAARVGMQPYQVQPRMLSSLDRLADHFEAQERDRRSAV